MRKIGLSILILSVFISLTSVLPFFPGQLKNHQPWLILLILMLFKNARLTIILSIIFGWYLDIYSPLTDGFYLVIIPSTIILTLYFSLGWQSKRIWLVSIGRITIATILFYLLVFSFEFGYNFFIAKDSISNINIYIINTIISSIILNSLIGLLLSRMIYKLLPNTNQSGNLLKNGNPI
ncbi:MAG: hypothetical protein V1853_00545 [bacterium]